MRFDVPGTHCLSIWLASLIFAYPVWGSPNSKFSETSYVFIKNIQPKGNIILDDSLLAESLDVGSGFYMAPELLSLITEEAEGFYSSHGFHRVSVYIPKSKPIKGTLKLSFDEYAEIKTGQSDILRAKISVDRLIARYHLETDKNTKEKAIATLVELYRLKRATDEEAERLRLRAEQARAKTQREHYLRIQTEKQKAEEEMRLVRRENLMQIFDRQHQFLVEQEKFQSEKIHQMRDRMQTILDTRFNGHILTQDEPSVAPTPQVPLQRE